MAQFEKMMYETLDPTNHEIRILLLQPSNDIICTIRCQLHRESLDDEDLRFEALSYVWGDPEPAQEIEVDGVACQIRPNLHSALRRLRRDNDVRRLWVDALCIHQKDNIEKSHQVVQMGRVYSTAAQTNAWLGENEKGHLAMDLAKRIHESGSMEALDNLCHERALRDSWVGLSTSLWVYELTKAYTF
jgi:hypothetical protein